MEKMIGILAYGSLINPDELSQNVTDLIPVTLCGYRRVFNQTPSWRRGEGNKIGVLNVERDEAHTINAVCLCLKETQRLDIRERGYHKARIATGQITCYPGHTLPEAIECYLFVGKAAMQSDEILPNHEYLKICMAGARAWGERFYREFVKTTYLADGRPLREYL